jgi:hypothetical protein
MTKPVLGQREMSLDLVLVIFLKDINAQRFLGMFFQVVTLVVAFETIRLVFLNTFTTMYPRVNHKARVRKEGSFN